MRAAVRPVFLVALLITVAAAQSQPSPTGGYNLLNFGKGSPTPTPGGVDVVVTTKPTAGYTCTEIVIRVIRVSDGQTLDSHTVARPGATVSKPFTGLGSHVPVRVAVEATFQNGNVFDFKDIEDFVTTR
jgi:hypothetical protein